MKNISTKLIKQLGIFLVISLLIELFIFNRQMFLSIGGNSPTELTYSASSVMTGNADGTYTLVKSSSSYIEISEVDGSFDYLYLDIDCRDSNGKVVPLDVKLSIADEGNSSYYDLPTTSIYPSLEKTKYIKAYSYGDVNAMRIHFTCDSAATLTINNIVYNANPPIFFSSVRFLLIFLILFILWSIRPKSELYQKKFSVNSKLIVIYAVFIINAGIWLGLTQTNQTIVNPPWIHHKQYHRLAVALSQGEVSITTGLEDEISALANPYDTAFRQNNISNSYDVWDLAFFEGKFYVYFGIVPVLLFYLPYYLIFGSAFPTYFGIYIMGSAILAGVFYLMWQIVRNYFKKTPFLLYVVLSVIVGNSIGTIPIIMRPDFYSLPIMCALCFTIWGLGLWLSAASDWKRELNGEIVDNTDTVAIAKKLNFKINLKLVASSLCMALVAGCRPQFLMGSFLIFFIFGTCIKEDFKNNKKRLLIRTACVAAPYIIVAAGIMYYNFIRFGSPFDFGANYNLTTNDMTQRGFNLGRLADGIYQYLLQFPNLGAKFPYVFSVPFNSEYLGKTIREAMFGGVFFTHIILFALFAIKKVKNALKDKGLLGITIASVAFAIIIVIADTEMAGLLSRYYSDFLWLLIIPAVIIILQLWESLETPSHRNMLIMFVIIAGLFGLFMDWGTGININMINIENSEMYHYLKSLLG